MSRSTPQPRAIVLALLLPVFLLSAALTGDNTDPEARAAATAWLALIDAGEYQESWDESARAFQEAVTRDQWVQQGAAVKQQVGDNVSREEVGLQPATNPPGAPPGEYISIQYRSEFTALGEATEVVVLSKDAERGWRVTGYFVQPPAN